MGNAITNAVVVFWAGFDWIRNTVNKISAGVMQLQGIAIGRFFVCVCLIAYGIFIVILGLKGNKLIKYLGRIREVTYLIVIFTPIFYEVLPLTFQHLFAAVLFFPVYYFLIELLNHYMPNPKAVAEDIADASGGGSDFGSPSPSMDSDLGGMEDLKL